MKKFFIIIFAYLLVSLGIVHVLLMREEAIDLETNAPDSSADTDIDTDPDLAKPQIQMGGRLNWPESGNFRTLDPKFVGDTSSSMLVRSVYDGLVQFNKELKIEPALAEDYEVSEDGTLYTFFLRRDVTFHDDPCFPDGKGRKLTADDVVYSFNRQCEGDSQNFWLLEGVVKGADEYHKKSLEGSLTPEDTVAGVRKVGRYDIEVELNFAFSPFICRLAMSSMAIYPREAVEKYNSDGKTEFAHHPVGTGPFIMKEYDQDRYAKMVKNQNYWGVDAWGNKLPYLDEVYVTVDKEESQVYSQFLKGNYDWCRIPLDSQESILTEDMKLQDDFKKYKLQSTSALIDQYYGFMMDRPPFQGNKKLRQAFNYMINREAICKYVSLNQNSPMRGPLPPGMNGYNPDLQQYTYDPDKAKQLLAEAGFPNGVGLEKIKLNLNLGGGPNLNIAEAIQDQIKQFGVQIELEQKSWSEHQELINNHQAVFFRYGWVGDYPDPENFLLLFDSRKKAPDGPNSTQYENEEFDKLYQAALREVDESKRIELFRQAEAVVMDDAPWLFLFYSNIYRLNQPWLMGAEENAMELRFFEQYWLNKKN